MLSSSWGCRIWAYSGSLDVLDADLGSAFRDYIRPASLGFAIPVVFSIHSLVANLGRRE